MTTLYIIGAGLVVVGLLIWLLVRKSGKAAEEAWRRQSAEMTNEAVKEANRAQINAPRTRRAVVDRLRSPDDPV